MDSIIYREREKERGEKWELESNCKARSVNNLIAVLREQRRPDRKQCSPGTASLGAFRNCHGRSVGQAISICRFFTFANLVVRAPKCIPVS